jgi:hypothetical protein
MTDSMNIADRCEGAEAGSRALDYDIAHLTGHHFANGGKAPHYTTSLDAAMTLAPAGASWSLYDVIGKRESVRMWGDGFDVLRSGQNPALAFCAASFSTPRDTSEGVT